MGRARTCHPRGLLDKTDTVGRHMIEEAELRVDPTHLSVGLRGSYTLQACLPSCF